MFSIGFLVSVTGVIVAGLAGVLGVWMEKDPDGKVGLALFFSALILFASFLEMGQTIYANAGADQTDAKMALLLERLSELSENSPELQQFVATEVAVAARANPQVVQRMESNVRAKGGDPNRVRQMATSGRRQAAGLSAKKGDPPVRRPAARKGGARTQSGARPAAAKTDDKAVLDAARQGDMQGARAAAQGQAGAAANDAKKAAGAAATKATGDAKAAATDAGNKAKGAATDAANKAGGKAKDAGNKAKDDAKNKAKDAAGKLGF